MDRTDTPRPGVAEFRDVPLVDGADQRAGAYLHLGLSRNQGSAIVRAFLLVAGYPQVEWDSGPSHPGYLGEGAVYLSPPDAGPSSPGLPTPRDQGSYDLQLNIARRLEALAPSGPTVDLALAISDAAGSPLDTSGFQIGRLEITRR